MSKINYRFTLLILSLILIALAGLIGLRSAVRFASWSGFFYSSEQIHFLLIEYSKKSKIAPGNLSDVMTKDYDKDTLPLLKSVDELITNYNPIILLERNCYPKNIRLWVKATRNIEPNWILIVDGTRDLSPQSHPPKDSLVLWMPGRSKNWIDFSKSSK